MTADASAIVAAFAPWHEEHEAAAERIEEVSDLVAHAELEAFSVLTRLPPELRVPTEVAAEYLGGQFPGARLVLPPDQRAELLGRLVDSGVFGGRVYDALIGLTAAAHAEPLLSCDRRAVPTYRRLGVDTELL